MIGPAVEVKDLTVRFGDTAALESVSFAVPQDSFVAVIGPNGAGKSTLLHALLGTVNPDSGSVAVSGQSPRALEPGETGFIPQTKTLDRTFPATAIEVVTTGLTGRWPWRLDSEIRKKALHVMQQMGVDTLAHRQVAALSGGELQRVYLARCLARRPKLLLLDEPAAGMDVRGEAEMYHLLDGYRAETDATVLMVTHDWEGARTHATHVLLLDRRLVMFGTPQEAGDEARLLEVFGYTGHVGATHSEAGGDA